MNALVRRRVKQTSTLRIQKIGRRKRDIFAAGLSGSFRHGKLRISSQWTGTISACERAKVSLKSRGNMQIFAAIGSSELRACSSMLTRIVKTESKFSIAGKAADMI